MGKRKLGALEKIDADLASLQYKIRKDPTLYREEFLRQYEQYEAQRDIFRAAPTSDVNSNLVSFRDLVDFVAHVADCYPDLTAAFFGELSDTLTAHHAVLQAELREKIVGSLVLLRKKGLVDSERLLLALFPILIATSSKSLRAILFQKIVSELRSANAKSANHRLNRTFQTVLFKLVTADRLSAQAIWAVRFTRELWRRRVWTDAKAVEIMKEASLADNQRVAAGGVRFFLGADQEAEDSSSDDDSDDGIDIAKLKHQVGVTKKTRKKTRNFERAVATVKKKERAKKQPQQLNFSALHLLHDPQGFSETLFSRHLQSSKSKLNLAHKLLVLQLVSRLVGLHKLTVMHLYSYFLKYLTPRQPSVTSFLASLAQATHNLVPPDALEPLVQKIANEFVSEAVAAEVASAGLNAIREICLRQPLAMSDTLLQDLVMYRKSKDKSVMMAAKGLLGLYREVAPEMLKKKDRGKDAVVGLMGGERKEKRFGEEDTGGIEGLELLEEWKREKRKRKLEEAGVAGDIKVDGNAGDAAALDDDEEADSAEWEVDDEDSDDSGGWINAESGDEIEIELNSSGDGEDDERPVKRAKSQGDEEVESQDDGLSHNGDPDRKLSNLATTKILTPADLAKLQELKTQANIEKLMGGSKRRKQVQERKEHNPEAPLTAADISSHALSKRDINVKINRKPDVDDDDDDENKHQRRSKAAQRQARKTAAGKGTTNKEKARRKNFIMTLAKAKGKAKRSLVQKRKVLRAHAERGKRGGRRGNHG